MGLPFGPHSLPFAFTQSQFPLCNFSTLINQDIYVVRREDTKGREDFDKWLDVRITNVYVIVSKVVQYPQHIFFYWFHMICGRLINQAEVKHTQTICQAKG